MRLSKFSGVLVMAVGALPFACFDTDITCEDELTCSAGKGGTSGKGGSGGASGGVGDAGASGDGSGEGGGGASGASGAGGEAGGDGVGGGAGTGRGGGGGTSGTSGGAGMFGGQGGDAGSGPPPCDPTSTPDDEACVVDEEYGVFVSPVGDNDEGDGSRARPFATLAKAVEAAISEGKRVYACGDEGSFAESVSLDATAGSLEMFGGFACSDWTFDAEAKTAVVSPTSRALHIDGAVGVHIEAFRFEAADGLVSGESSVGALIVNAEAIVLRRVRIEAGAGVAGADGTPGTFTFPAREDLDGNNAVTTVGGATKICDCPAGVVQTSGGPGGAASPGGQDGGNGTPDHVGFGGEGGDADATSCGLGGAGLNGGAAPAAAAAPGASELGSLQLTGWMPAAGTDGPSGSPGQGGGGGASSATGGGGGGGCGGCGGAGGKGGRGGGASIGLAILASAVTIEDSELVATDAGDGGDGVPGQAGQAEAGFSGNGTLGGCQGGAGGFGGSGAAGGGGAGGISAALVWSGEAAPTEIATTRFVGLGGAKGVGGEPGANDGLEGIAEEILEIP